MKKDKQNKQNKQNKQAAQYYKRYQEREENYHHEKIFWVPSLPGCYTIKSKPGEIFSLTYQALFNIGPK